MKSAKQLIESVVQGNDAFDVMRTSLVEEGEIKPSEVKVLQAFLAGDKAKSQRLLSNRKVLSSPKTGVIFANIINKKVFFNPDAPEPLRAWIRKNSEGASPDFGLKGQGARLHSGKLATGFEW